MRNSRPQAVHNHLLVLTVLIALVLGAAPAAVAQGPEAGGWWANPQMIERLQLTEEQVKQIEGLIYESGSLMIDLKAKLGKKALELDRLLRADMLDDDAVQSTIDQLADTKCTIEREQLMVRYQVARLLNPKQRDQIRRYLERNKRERRERRERRQSSERMDRSERMRDRER